MIFSVIVPVYNAEKYIENMLKSILEQKLPEKSEIEVILIENGSTDKSPEICDSIADKYELVKCYHYGKIGAYAARNEGVRLACGEWIIFADADDELSGEIFTEIYNEIAFWREKSKEPDIVLHNAASMDTPGIKMFSFPFTEGKIYEEADKDEFYRIMCMGDSLNAMWNKCVKKELALETKEISGNLLNHGEDLLQTADYIDRAKAIVYIDKALYLYRENSGGLTGSYHAEFMDNQIKAWKAFDNYAVKWTGNTYSDVIDARKALTCSIGVKSLIYSGLSWRDKEKKLDEIMKLSFFKQYGKLSLPKWAPQEDEFVHDMIISDNSKNELMKSARWHDVKAIIKKAIKWK